METGPDNIGGSGVENEVEGIATSQSETGEEKSGIQGRWLLLAAIAVIAIPVLIGFLLMRDDSSSTLADAGLAEDTSSGAMSDDGMGSDSADQAETPAGVEDFADIQATEIQIEFDTSGGAAILTVDTSIDLACSVVYGPTTAFGSLATDTDMAGGAHSNHHPRMTGLSGGALWYMIQGTAVDGTIYQSEVMQITVPEGSGGGEVIQPPGSNVAPDARVIDVSSEYSADYGAANAVDNDLATEWSSAGDGDDSYITLDFGEDMVFSGVGFRTRSMTDGTSITTSFTVSIDGKEYGPFDAGPGLSVALLEATGQTIRFDVHTSTGGNTGAIEVEVYAEPDM